MSSGGLDVFVKRGLVVLNVELMVSNVVIRFSYEYESDRFFGNVVLTRTDRNNKPR